MRPATTTASAADALIQGVSRPRKHSDSQHASSPDEHSASSSAPMLYFLADEATMAAATSASAASTALSSSSQNFGVRSLQESVSDSELRRERRSPVKEEKHEEEEEEEEEVDEDDQLDTHSMASLSTANPDFMSGIPSPKTNMSVPLTPVLGPSIAPSPINSPVASRTASDGEADDYMGGGGPQLIMPQIVIPSRRPFTEKGKRIGRLKMLIAGDSGIGKTSLIKSIVQTCEDIVHVDPLMTDNATRRSRRNGDSESTRKITEVYASTRPYPQWWSEIDDSKVLRRRKSRCGPEEQVIERNLCFVDTPGYGSGTSFLECIEPVVRYVETQFERTQSIIVNGEGDLMSLLSGNGTPAVDIVFYVVLHRLKPVDIEFMRRLSPFTNVLPVIAKSDTLTPQQVTSLKLSILSDLRSAGVRPFLFGKSSSDILRSAAMNADGEASTVTAPFAISSIVSSDSENMDASVLMSPDYVPPLIDTELKLLVDQVFDPDNISWLKHSAAKKYMLWRQNVAAAALVTTRTLGSPGRPSTPPRSPSASGMLVQFNRGTGNVADSFAADSFALARVADHTQREERLAKVRLSRWANDLQRSLAAEKERYERLARGERAVWLTERLGECIADGQLVPITSLGGKGLPKVEPTGNLFVDTRDPFGILQLNETVGRKVLVMIKIAGLGGLVGVVGVWVYKQWGAAGLQELVREVGSR
ncbi:Septin-domain-containing protein [Sphaerosporella brunnea]|uniref:Septin-domain-containing protein n=1 Tax=Sphaerosporella brunnea TaxID=1250544 RepID=A0A5J5EKX3_9PEZI|nr:Septin-domain-containing protein [Sphaerosporella brunnea]